MTKFINCSYLIVIITVIFIIYLIFNDIKCGIYSHELPDADEKYSILIQTDKKIMRMEPDLFEAHLNKIKNNIVKLNKKTACPTIKKYLQKSHQDLKKFLDNNIPESYVDADYLIKEKELLQRQLMDKMNNGVYNSKSDDNDDAYYGTTDEASDEELEVKILLLDVVLDIEQMIYLVRNIDFKQSKINLINLHKTVEFMYSSMCFDPDYGTAGADYSAGAPVPRPSEEIAGELMGENIIEDFSESSLQKYMNFGAIGDGEDINSMNIALNQGLKINKDSHDAFDKIGMSNKSSGARKVPTKVSKHKHTTLSGNDKSSRNNSVFLDTKTYLAEGSSNEAENILYKKYTPIKQPRKLYDIQEYISDPSIIKESKNTIKKEFKFADTYKPFYDIEQIKEERKKLAMFRNDLKTNKSLRNDYDFLD